MIFYASAFAVSPGSCLNMRPQANQFYVGEKMIVFYN